MTPIGRDGSQTVSMPIALQIWDPREATPKARLKLSQSSELGVSCQVKTAAPCDA